MSWALSGGGGRLLGRSLLTLADVITAAVPLAADWNDSHIFNERWPAHARFHGVTALDSQPLSVSHRTAPQWLLCARHRAGTAIA